jgi:hypothetical protein
MSQRTAPTSADKAFAASPIRDTRRVTVLALSVREILPGAASPGALQDPFQCVCGTSGAMWEQAEP